MRASRFATLALLLLLVSSCILRGAESPRRPDLPADFRLRLAYGNLSPDSPRTELAILPRPDGPWEILIRRSSGGGEWPRLWDQAYSETLDEDGVAGLAGRLQQIGFFDLAFQHEAANSADLPSLTLEVVQWGRRHLVTARGRQPSKLVASLEALDGTLGIRLSPWPAWLSDLSGGALTRPALVRDLRASLALHRRWLKFEPERGPLHLDLFALELATGNPEAARRELLLLSRNKSLQGLVPELEALLR